MKNKFNPINGCLLMTPEDAVSELKLTIKKDPSKYHGILAHMFRLLINESNDPQYIKDAYTLFTVINTVMLSEEPLNSKN